MKLDDLISPEYRVLNQELHEQPRKFGQSGRKHAGEIMAVAAALGIKELLDYGCGCSTLRDALRQQDWMGLIYEYDPAVPAKQALPDPAAMVVCTDVLEHVEPDKLKAVLKHLRKLTIEAAFFAISTVPSNKSLRDGRNAHLIVEPYEWWLAQVGAHGFRVRSRFLRYTEAGITDVGMWLSVA